jgi:hypothetical protein
MNEFFRCPSFSYGAFVISILLMIIGVVLSKTVGSAGDKLMLWFSGIIGLGWFVWVLYNFFFRVADCERVGEFNGSFRNPFVDIF